MESIDFLCDSHHGIYIPNIMIDRLVDAGWKLEISTEDVETLKEGPEDAWYWEAWDNLLNNATYTDEAGNVWNLYQDGDLFAYCFETMTAEEKSNLLNIDEDE